MVLPNHGDDYGRDAAEMNSLENTSTATANIDIVAGLRASFKQKKNPIAVGLRLKN